MRRVLVPLDGSELATKIIPDARRLAGPNGDLVLVREIGMYIYPSMGWYAYDRTLWDRRVRAHIAEAQDYLDAVAGKLASEGVKVAVHTSPLTDVAQAIDEAARAVQADMIACATHGRGPVGRLFWGGVAWRVLAHSTVPVMVRHFSETAESDAQEPEKRRILVPLDGSAYAERALHLATQLADEWDAELSLVRVVPTLPPAPTAHVSSEYFTDPEAAIPEARTYLENVTRNLSRPAEPHLLVGPVVESLCHAVSEYGITDVVITTHGHTALSRVLLGSVADALIHRLSLPITVIPSLAAARQGEGETLEVPDVVHTLQPA